ncbi:hypothetical protein, partial [Paenibacillus sonchi]|uniref:hypothetical protein n=1 Tax=Paenibacillus sonchi TaxID=373687 RepID=UPI001E386F00
RSVSIQTSPPSLFPFVSFSSSLYIALRFKGLAGLNKLVGEVLEIIEGYLMPINFRATRQTGGSEIA